MADIPRIHMTATAFSQLPESDVYFDDLNVVQPDVFWIAPDSQCTLGEDGCWHGAPDLVVEGLSPSTAKRGKDEKYELYQKSGVREYWVIAPIARYLEVYTLVDGKFVRYGFSARGRLLHRRC